MIKTFVVEGYDVFSPEFRDAISNARKGVEDMTEFLGVDAAIKSSLHIGEDPRIDPL